MDIKEVVAVASAAAGGAGAGGAAAYAANSLGLSFNSHNTTELSTSMWGCTNKLLSVTDLFELIKELPTEKEGGATGEKTTETGSLQDRFAVQEGCLNVQFSTGIIDLQNKFSQISFPK